MRVFVKFRVKVIISGQRSGRDNLKSRQIQATDIYKKWFKWSLGTKFDNIQEQNRQPRKIHD